jgi:hypothetical protein
MGIKKNVELCYIILDMVSLYQIHGLIQMIVFLFLFPLGATIALFRKSVGPNWRKMHVTVQLTAITLFFIAISLAFYAGNIQNKNKEKKEEKQINKVHKALGRIIFILIVSQLIWAYQGRKLVNWMTWYYIHMTLSALIIISGVTNVLIAWKMISKK